LQRWNILTVVVALGLAVPAVAQSQLVRKTELTATQPASLDTTMVDLPRVRFDAALTTSTAIAGEQAGCWTQDCVTFDLADNANQKQVCLALSTSSPMPSRDVPEPERENLAAKLPDAPEANGYDSSSKLEDSLAVTPVRSAVVPHEAGEERVQWAPLLKGSLRYVAVMHGFRLATEPGTREGLHNSVVGGYFKALGALHGWSDGDTYYENYLGHPIQGSVSAYLWIHNDKERFRNIEFGMSRDYWMSRLRAYAFAWAFSEQFEIGPISEASIGQIQRYCCQYGFVDHVITPNGGMVWVLGEDILDKYLIRRIEDHTDNAFLRAAARTWLDPVQGMANLMNMEWPWYRENRGPLREYHGELYPRPSEPKQTEFPLVPKFEIAAAVPELMRFGNLSCEGGGGVAGFRMSESWQWSVEVSGCTLGNSLPTYWSGDQLSWTTGPQWIRHTQSRLSPHAHFRVGGQKITEKQVDPQVLSWVGGPPPMTDGENSEGQRHWEMTGFSMSMGGGLDVRLNAGLAWRFANFDYVRSWLGQLNGVNFDRGFRFTTGVVLRIGTW